jgi:DNA-binding transcriptional MocR family regulator
LTVQNAYAELQNGGWIEATVGRGTFVSPNVQHSAFGRALTASATPDAVIGDILQANSIVGVRSLAAASPDLRLFPVDEFWQSLMAQQHTLASASAYGSSQGEAQLRVAICDDLHERGLEVRPDQILVVAGVTQGLSLLTQTLAQPGDRVLVEQPSYIGLLNTLKANGIEPVGIPMDAEGPLLDELERAIVRVRPRFFYTVPTFQNPTGRSQSHARRQALVELAAAHNLPLLEDDIYARLAYDQPPPAPLKALDQAGTVVYVTSYSKVLMPGLRLGFLVAPPHMAERLLSQRRASDLCSPPLLQRTLAAFLQNGGLKRHLKRVLPLYRERRNALVAALQLHMPPAVQWTAPQGGFCTWLTMPNHHDFVDLEQAALRQGWAVTPGEVFLAGPESRKSIRICFGGQPPEALQSGIQSVGQLVRERLLDARRPLPVAGDWPPLV